MRNALFLVVLVLTSSSMAAAQSEYKKWEFFGGYSHNRVDTGLSDDDPDFDDFIDEREGFHGFNMSITRNVSRYVGLKFDFAGHFKKRDIPFLGTPAVLNIDSRIFNFLGGVQVKDNATDATFKPFGHALVGGAHFKTEGRFNGGCIGLFPSPCPSFSESDTGFAAAVGGGVDMRVSNRVDVRVIQFDYNPSRIADSTQHNFRIGVGIVFH
jgi:opacity protein-like surface antigen